MINSPHVAPFLMGCAGSRAVTPSLGGNGHAAEVSDADAAPAKTVDPPRCLATVGLDDQLRWASAPPWPYGESGQCHAPVVVLDVGKGMKGIKSSFFKIFPRGKFMTVADFCDDALLGKCVVLIHGGGEHKNYIGDSEKEKLAEHLRRGGAIMTISAGGTFCGCNKGSLGLLPILAHDRQHWQRGTGSVVLKPTPYGEQLLPKIKEVESKYFNCPALLPVAEEHLAAFGTTLPGLPILTYETEMNDCQSATSLLGLPAVQLGELGEGRFVVISPNLEVNAGDVNIRLFRSLAAWASAGHLRPLVTGGEAIHGPRFDETSMTGTDRDGGELYTFPIASGKLPALSAECIAALGEELTEFTLPGNCRLVILDLGKGDELPSIFAALVPEAQRVIVAPQELDATLQPGDVIFLHGGMANEHAQRLGVLGRRRIRRHLAEGGSVMGVCAGAHWLSCRDLPLWGHALPLVPHDNQNWRRGIGDLSIDFTSEGQRILGLEGSVDDLRYANGPLLVALDLETYRNYQPGKMPQQESAEQEEINLQAAGPPVPLAVFANCSDAKVTDWATMQGHAAIWAWQTAQGGKAVALSPHPEYHQTEQSRRLFRRLLLWCAAAT